VNAGENLKFEINFKNEGETGLRDVIVTEKIDSLVLDYSTLRLDKGAFDEKNKTITWKASDYPALKNLAPSQGGKIGFSISVKAVIPVGSENDKNFVISSVAKIDSPDIATPIEMNKIIAGNKIDMKLNSKLVLDVKGYYNDGNIPNSGPLPPKVNEETTYTVHWVVSNISNDVSGAKVETVLSSGVTMTGKFYPEDASVTYNERNNSLVWEIGSIKAATGVLSKAKEVSFQVKIKPSSSQIGREVELLGESVITAKDLFTGADLKMTASGKNSNLPEDESLSGKYRVVN
jgi:hypothetical protein